MSHEPEVLPSLTSYYDAVKGRPPRDTAVAAAEYFKKENITPQTIIDLGCGDGPDTVFMLDQGWRVHAIDQSEEGLARLKARLTSEQMSRLTMQTASFETLVLPLEIDWVNASFSLPFCPPDHFDAFWHQLVTAIKPGGILSGQLFGDHDTWKDKLHITTLSLTAVQSLLSSFELLHFEEGEKDGTTATGTPKHWHVFNFVARKKYPSKTEL